MNGPIYIGDEVSATGYRLAGVAVHVPQQDNLFAEIQAVCENASLVLLSTEFASRLEDDKLQLLLAHSKTPLVVMPDVRGQHPVADLATKLRQQLGVLE